MKISVFFVFLFAVSMVSANGLGIVGENTFTIEKNQSVDTEFQVTIQNQDSFTFYNITLEGEGVAAMSKISELGSGQSANVTIRLNEDAAFDGKLKIIGEYEASLGASNQTEIVEISYEDGVDRCDLSLVKGDSVMWKNNGLDEVRLKDTNTGEYFLTIEDGKNATRLFSEPIVLEYVGVWIIPFTEICTIEVSDDEGLRHNLEYDTEITLNLSILYKETSIETTFLSTSYSLDYNRVRSGEYFSIKNTGSEILRVEKLSSDWITFPENEAGFNIGVGDSANIEYEISPMVRLTNETNKTYIKTILIEGNFPSVKNNISIYVKHANLDEIIGGDHLTEDWFDNMVDLGCLAFPDNERCKRTISYYNGSSGSGLEFTEESSILFLEKYGEDLIVENKDRKADAEFKANLSETMEQIDDRLGVVENETTTTNEVSRNASNTSLFLVVLIASGIILTIVTILIIKQRRKMKVEKDLGISTEESYG